MDCTENGLSILGQGLHQIADGPAGLAVQSRGWLIQEKQQLRARSQFHSNCQSLALLHVEPFSWYPDDGIRILPHVQKVNHGLNIRELFSSAVLGRLSEQGTELQGFTDRRGVEVQILLLHIASLTLEGFVSNATVHQHIATNNTDRRATRQYVQ